MALGVIISLIAIVPFVMDFNTETFGLTFLGFPLVFIGLSLTAIAFQREMGRYNINENKENSSYMAKYMINETRDEFVKTVKAARSDDNIKKSFCPNCGSENDSDASYCKGCGRSLKNICPHCGTSNDIDAKYCDNCGKKL